MGKEAIYISPDEVKKYELYEGYENAKCSLLMGDIAIDKDWKEAVDRGDIDMI